MSTYLQHYWAEALDSLQPLSAALPYAEGMAACAYAWKIASFGVRPPFFFKFKAALIRL
jgi:hypothetical protein